jgi:hypothetical protein
MAKGERVRKPTVATRHESWVKIVLTRRFEQHLQVVNVYDVDLARDSEDRL